MTGNGRRARGRSRDDVQGGADETVAAIVAAARACVGSPFRLQGRDPAIGLDCVGVADFAFRAAGAEPSLPDGYALRGGDLRDAEDRLFASGFTSVDGRAAGAGDLLVLRPGARQLHLAVHSGAAFIHADLGLRSVVETPGRPPWPLLGSWRWRRGSAERKN